MLTRLSCHSPFRNSVSHPNRKKYKVTKRFFNQIKDLKEYKAKLNEVKAYWKSIEDPEKGPLHFTSSTTLEDIKETLISLKERYDDDYRRELQLKEGLIKEGDKTLTPEEEAKLEEPAQDENGDPIPTDKEEVKRKKIKNAIVYAEKMYNDYQASGMEFSTPMISLRARKKAYELHRTEPDYWTPIRLSNTFKIDSHEMKILLWDMKIETDAIESGVEIDYSLHEAMEEKFGRTDFPDTIPDTPSHVYRKQTRKTFFYIPPEIPSNLLMEHLNKRDSKNYREGVKVQPRAAPKQRVHPPMMVSGLKREKKHKNVQFFYCDTSNNLDAYQQPIVVKDMDGTLRDPTWEERKDIRILTTHTRHYEPTPYNVWDDNNNTPVEHMPPPGFVVEFEEA